MTKLESGQGTWTVFFEADGMCFHIRRATRRLARIEALQQQRARGGFVTINRGGIERDSVGPEGASWL